jgi:hypothetical protein
MSELVMLIHSENNTEGGPGQHLGPTYQPPVAMSVLHRLKDCIYVVYSSQFDPRAQD